MTRDTVTGGDALAETTGDSWKGGSGSAPWLSPRHADKYRLPSRDYVLKVAKLPVVRRCVFCGFETLPGSMEETGEAWKKHMKRCKASRVASELPTTRTNKRKRASARMSHEES